MRVPLVVGEPTLALALMVLGLALLVPVACWFGIQIGRERERMSSLQRRGGVPRR